MSLVILRLGDEDDGLPGLNIGRGTKTRRASQRRNAPKQNSRGIIGLDASAVAIHFRDELDFDALRGFVLRRQCLPLETMVSSSSKHR